MTKLKKTTERKLVALAEKHILELEGRGDLKQHWSDEEDFFETSVWSLEALLIEAYELGKKEAH